MSNFDLNEDNPFQAPSTVEVAPQNELEGDAVAIRRHHLSHEASIKGMGWLYVLVGFFLILGGVEFLEKMNAMNAMAGNAGPGGTEFVFRLVIPWLLVPTGVLQLVTGLGMRKVRPWTKIPGTLLAAVICLINIPPGMFLGVYTLYLLHSNKGRVVLAEAYQGIIAVTPEIKYKTPTYVKVIAIVLLVSFVLAIGFAMFSA